LTKQGTIRWVNAIATPMFSPEGQLLGYVGTVEDITARKQAEEALRESEARLKLAMQSAQWGYWDLNLLTGESVWSSESKQLLGLPPDWQETNYETLISRIHPDDRLVIEQAVERAISSGNYETEFRVIWADGSIHWLEDRGQVYYDKTGRAVRMVGMVKDISDRKQTEAALHQNRALLN
jgi:PAS domain S-box-containing protein